MTSRYTQADKDFMKDLVRRFYPDVYQKNYGMDTYIVKKVLTLKELKKECKERKISYFNSMSRTELQQAVEWHRDGKTVELEALCAEAKKRYLVHAAKYQLSKKQPTEVPGV